jgi:hypothetical protein
VQFEESRCIALRQHFLDGYALDIPVADQLQEARVRKLDAMFRSAQHGDEARCLIEHLRQPLVVARFQHLPRRGGGRFRMDAEHPYDLISVISYRGIRQREMPVRGAFVAIEGDGDIVQVDDHAAEQSVEQGAKLGVGVWPHREERLTQRGWMFGSQQGHVGIVVQQRAREPPNDEHRLPGGKNQGHDGPQRLRPSRRVPELRRRPVGGKYGLLQGETTGEHGQRRFHASTRTLSSIEAGPRDIIS